MSAILAEPTSKPCFLRITSINWKTVTKLRLSTFRLLAGTFDIWRFTLSLALHTSDSRVTYLTKSLKVATWPPFSSIIIDSRTQRVRMSKGSLLTSFVIKSSELTLPCSRKFCKVMLVLSSSSENDLREAESFAFTCEASLHYCLQRYAIMQSWPNSRLSLFSASSYATSPLSPKYSILSFTLSAQCCNSKQNTIFLFWTRGSTWVSKLVINDLNSTGLPLNSDRILEYSARTRVHLEYHFLRAHTRTRNPRYSAGTRTRRSMYSVLGQKKSRVHEYIWPSLKVINKMNIW